VGIFFFTAATETAWKARREIPILRSHILVNFALSRRVSDKLTNK
jgi:hypothetical protein